MKLNDLDFMSNSKKQTQKDIGIHLHKDDAFGLSIRNGCESKIADVNGSVGKGLLIAYNDGRLYFKGTNSKDGFTITVNPECVNKYCKISLRHVTEDFKDWIVENEGNYDLKYDYEAKLYFISNGMQFMSRGGVI